MEKTRDIVCHSIYTVSSPKKAKTLPKALSKEDTLFSLDKVASLSETRWIDLRNRKLAYLNLREWPENFGNIINNKTTS